MSEENKIELFLNEIEELCKKYDLSISHQDFQGAFIIEKYDEKNIEWLKDADIRIDTLDWEKAINHLVDLMLMYGSIGSAGSFGFFILMGYKNRYDKGERSKDLYEKIMNAE